MSQKYTNAITTYPVFNGLVPSGGPKAAPLWLDFSAATEYDVDLTALQSSGRIDMLQSLFIDNKGNASPVDVTVVGTTQVVEAPAHTQGYYPILCTNPPKLIITSVGGVIVPMFLLNFTIGGIVWATA